MMWAVMEQSIPKSVRDRLGLRPGVRMTYQIDQGKMTVTPESIAEERERVEAALARLHGMRGIMRHTKLADLPEHKREGHRY
jgi:bifunctional DNA-binding transcriptional regulator/antitoxin component of YhaV-PrlF toxin-antitoxin module